MEKVIEESNVELLELFDQVSEDARKEKMAVPPINEMLYWWTRKPLVVGRAIALASTLNDITAVKNLMGLGREKRAYTYIPDAGVYKKKLGRDPSEIKVLDPFGGGGNLIFEAKRLGLDCTVSDYNPVAYLLEKAVLEYPPKYGLKLAEDFEKYAKLVIEKTKEEVGKFYERNVLIYFWVWCIKCPHCGQRVPLTNQMWIANNDKNKIGIRFEVTPDKNFKTQLIRNMTTTEGKKFTQKGGKATCIGCKNPINYEDLTNDIATRKDRELIVKQTQGIKNRDYTLTTEKDDVFFKRASEYMKSKLNEYEKEHLIPTEVIKPSHQDTLSHFGIIRWSDFFSSRQLLLLSSLLKNMKKVIEDIDDKEFANVIGLYLGLLLCKHVNSNTLGLAWNISGEKYAHTLTMRRPAFVFNHVEISPFEKVGGSLNNIVSNISGAISFASLNKFNATISLTSVLELPLKPHRYDLIITDPPYRNDVQYGELSEFFYVWLIRLLRNNYPELPNSVNLDEDLSESKFRFENQQLAYDFFEKGFKKAFQSMNKILKDDGLLVVFFAHSSPEAWNLLLECIRESRFSVVSSYAIHTESTNNPIASGKASFMSSIVVSCRKIKSISSTVYFEDLLPLIEDKIKNMLANIPREKFLSLPITDLLVMVYGKVLEASTQHTILKSYKKDFEPNFETLIHDSRDYLLKEIVTKLTGRTINILGSHTSFYLLTKIFQNGVLSSDDSMKIARAYGLDPARIEDYNLGIREEGVIRLYYLYELEFDKKPEEMNPKNIHEQLCYLSYIIEKYGVTKIPSIITQKNFKIDDIAQVVDLLIKNYHLRKNKNKSLTPQEQKELKILEILADVFGVKTDDSLDSFFDKK